MSLSFDNSEAGCMLFYDCHRSVPAPFLTKTYHLVNDPSTNEIVSWGEDDTSFVVWRPPEFARDLLPNYFKHNNFSSFVRQLNTYGFRKVVPDRWEFANDYFRRGERHLLCEIHRRKAAMQPASQQSRSLSPSTSMEDQAWSTISSGSPLSTSPAPVVVPTHQNGATLNVVDEIDRLRKDNHLLISELSRLRRLYEEAINVIQHQHQFQGSSTDLNFSPRNINIGASGQTPPIHAPPAILPGTEFGIHHQHLVVTPSLPLQYSSRRDHLAMVPGDSKPASKCSLGQPLHQLPQVAASSTTTPGTARFPVKLFGVPLNNDQSPHSAPGAGSSRDHHVGLKRCQSDQPSWEAVCDQISPRKCLRADQFSLAPEAWLQICATRDGGVYI